MRERDFHHKKACQSNDKCNNVHWKKYKELRNMINGMVNDAKREYYTNEINNAAGDMSKMWKTLKELLQNKKGNLSTLPLISNTVSDLAEKFNNHFINIVSLPDDISNSYNKCNDNRTEINCRFKFVKSLLNK